MWHPLTGTSVSSASPAPPADDGQPYLTAQGLSDVKCQLFLSLPKLGTTKPPASHLNRSCLGQATPQRPLAHQHLPSTTAAARESGEHLETLFQAHIIAAQQPALVQGHMSDALLRLCHD